MPISLTPAAAERVRTFMASRGKGIGLRLGVPWYAYDTVTFKGEVTAVEDGLITVKVVGSNSLGDHVVATVTFTMEGE